MFNSTERRLAIAKMQRTSSVRRRSCRIDLTGTDAFVPKPLSRSNSFPQKLRDQVDPDKDGRRRRIGWAEQTQQYRDDERQQERDGRAEDRSRSDDQELGP